MQQYAIREFHELVSLLEHHRNTPDRMLGEILCAEFGLDECQLQIALRRQKKRPGRHLGRILIEMGAVSLEQVNTALVGKFGIPLINLEELNIASQALSRVPVDVALQYNLMPLGEHNGVLIVAMENPLDSEGIEALRFNTRFNIAVVMAAGQDITLAHNKYYSKFDEDRALQESRLDAVNARPDLQLSPQMMAQQARTRPIVRLLNAIVLQGVLRGASDINIRPSDAQVMIYYRIDGQLQYSRTLDRSLLAPLVSRVKIIGHMDIAERRLPQDGNARLVRGRQCIDLRLSVLPTVNGESVVIRILDKEAGLKRLQDLGLTTRQQEIIDSVLLARQGLFLVTGQTGAGKSTTLYALLNEIKKENPHIITVEDPVEYTIEGVEQIQILEKKGLGFAQILRHILRHDPDVIMVGEIRDRETANIASRAALTGHLVLSTLHTNDAPGAVSRLLDLGVAPSILGATLLGVMSQRLIRLNCPHCLVADPVTAGNDLPVQDSYLRGVGCGHCHYTGFRGRTLVSEIMPLSHELALLISQAASHRELTELAVQQGMQRMRDGALQLAGSGRTTLGEALAVDTG